MYYFELLGGLGNQMFQYAAAKSISLKNNIPFKVYFNDGNIYTPRAFDLNNLNVKAQMAIDKEIPRNTLIDKFKRKLGFRHFFLEKEKYVYNDDIFKQPQQTYFEGYWQNEQYFLTIKSILLQEFKLKKKLDVLNKAYQNNISSQKNSVAVHIRRGDYLTNPKSFSYHGVCSLSYYQQAIALISASYSDCYFYFFSDDITFVEKNFKNLDHKTIIMGNTAHPEIDLILMSNCRHQIIANSSFSWWGAWLNKNEAKTVIAPKMWTNLHTADFIVPKEWQIL